MALPSSCKPDSDVIAELLGRGVEQIEPLSGGGNNRAYKVALANQAPVVAKFYFRSATDTRDRLKAEFSACRFLWEHGVTCIPQPLVSDSERGVGVYSFIRGERSLDARVTRADIVSAASFAKALNAASKHPDACALGAASEACFSPSSLLENLNKRLSILSSVQCDDTDVYADFAEIVRELTDGHRRACISLVGGEELPLACRTLSPSDFGFHNAIRTPQGLVFHDFEYFGWDDPVKLISDFVLHPGMPLSSELQEAFFGELFDYFAEREPCSQFADRFESLFPLFKLKWCCIVLNEFVPEFRARRQFARAENPDALQATLRKQLVKAARILGARSPVERTKAPLTEVSVKV